MAFLRWDENAMLQARYEDGFDDGVKEGENRLIKLLNTLIANGNQEELQMALNDKSKRNELFKKYGIIAD